MNGAAPEAGLGIVYPVSVPAGLSDVFFGELRADRYQPGLSV